MNIINIEHIGKIYGEKVIFKDASFGYSREIRSVLSELTEQESPHCLR